MKAMGGRKNEQGIMNREQVSKKVTPVLVKVQVAAAPRP
jgi:hypothetical protein